MEIFDCKVLEVDPIVFVASWAWIAVIEDHSIDIVIVVVGKPVARLVIVD